ncbi:SufE family protein [Actinobacillus porcinus]|uniref:SufE family protein n=1 Tax=Actinobacillus porcinus TaxID=51048 RepID=UPI0023F375C1|nr:SufE family protein [Actinobacillus porcinus]MDD7546008.1 SufE family protein [Actinobacillus porcinus]MDY5848819.1 SufE family protein [Actinobacillus porcinus]
MNIEAIKNAPNWEEKYRQLIQLGKNLTKPTDSELAQWQPISGCEVNLWAKIDVNSDRTLQLNAYSEARIMNGLLAILIHEVNGKSLEALANFDMTARFTELGIAQRLSDTRLNGLKQIEQKIRALALA